MADNVAIFVEAEGLIHLESPIYGEYTLCGDAFDLASDEPGYEWRKTDKRTVTCPQCAAVIRVARAVRTRVGDPR
jgi:hypothetical protein